MTLFKYIFYDLFLVACAILKLVYTNLLNITQKGRKKALNAKKWQKQGDFRLNMVPEVGLEPTRPHGRQILSLVRLPFRHSGP